MANENPDPFDNCVSLTAVLNRVNGGDENAFRELVDLAYARLRSIAKREMHEAFGQDSGSLTESPTSINHEAIIRLLGQRAEWRNSDHFFGVATILMRNIIRDFRRRRDALKRGGGNRGLRDDQLIASIAAPRSTNEPDASEGFDALMALNEEYPQVAEIVTLHIVAQNSFPKIAKLLGISLSKVEKDWRFARAWMRDYRGEQR